MVDKNLLPLLLLRGKHSRLPVCDNFYIIHFIAMKTGLNTDVDVNLVGTIWNNNVDTNCTVAIKLATKRIEDYALEFRVLMSSI